MTAPFLSFLRPKGGLVAFTTIPRLRTKTFELPNEIGAALEWLKAENEERRNVYYQHQLVRRRHPRRLKAEDVSAVSFIHLDIDWNDASGNRITASPEMIAEKVAELKAWKQPSALIGSGNGLQALWRLNWPISVALAKDINRGVLRQFGGDPSGSDGVKLLRVPGFINWPLRHPGLKPTRSKLIDLNDWAYEHHEFPQVSEPKTGQAFQVSAAVEEVTEDGLAALNLPAVLVEIIKTGRTSDRNYQPPRDTSRSGWQAKAAVWLLGRCGVPAGQVMGIFLNPSFGIAEKTFDQESRTEEEHARKLVADAKAFIRAGLLEDFGPYISEEPERFEPDIVEIIRKEDL